MNPLLLQQQLTCNELLREIKIRDKQIRFLQDKIILMHNQTQHQRQAIHNKYQVEMQRLKLSYKGLQQENINIMNKLQKRQLSHVSLQQSYQQLSNQVKVLTQANHLTIKHNKNIKRKYTQQQYQVNKIQEQNVQLRQLVNILEKQLKYMNQKNIKLMQEKNYLISTYKDYQQVKYQLREINNIRDQQYKKQVQIVKTNFIKEMNQNTRDIISQQLFSNNKMKKMNMNMNIKVGGDGVVEQSVDGDIESNSMQMTRAKVSKQKVDNMAQNDQRQHSIDEYITGCEEINYIQEQREYPNDSKLQQGTLPAHNQNWHLNKQVGKILAVNNKNNNNEKNKNNDLLCSQCVFERSWSEDIVRLKHILSYGQQYINSIIMKVGKQDNDQQNRGKQQKIQDQWGQQSQHQYHHQLLQQYQIYTQQQYNSNSVLKFNHTQSKEILNFIIQIVTNNNTLKQQLQSHKQIINNIKKQFQSQNQILSSKIDSLTQEEQRDNKNIQQIQKHYQQQIYIQQQQNKHQLEQWNKSKNKLYMIQHQLKELKAFIKTLTQLTAQIINQHLHYNHKHQISLGNNQLKINSLQKQSSLSSQLQTKSIKKSSQLKLKLKLKKVIISLIFIATIKKSALKLRRKTLLIIGKNNKNTLNKPSSIKNQSTIKQTMTLNNQLQEEERFSFYTQSTHNLIFQHSQIPKQIQISYQSLSFSKGNNHNNNANVLSTQNTHQLIQKCIFNTLKQQILNPKSNQSTNLQIDNYFKQLNNHQNSYKSVNLYQTVVKVIFQEMFLQRYL